MKNLTYLVLLLAMTLVGGCSTIATSINNKDFKTTLAIQYGITKMVHKKAEPVVAAVKIIDIAQDMKTFWGRGEEVLLSSAMSELNRAIPWQSLDQADTILALAMVNTVRESVRNEIKNGIISPDDIMHLDTIADAVIDAARLSL